MAAILNSTNREKFHFHGKFYLDSIDLDCQLAMLFQTNQDLKVPASVVSPLSLQVLK